MWCFCLEYDDSTNFIPEAELLSKYLVGIYSQQQHATIIHIDILWLCSTWLEKDWCCFWRIDHSKSTEASFIYGLCLSNSLHYLLMHAQRSVPELRVFDSCHFATTLLNRSNNNIATLGTTLGYDIVFPLTEAEEALYTLLSTRSMLLPTVKSRRRHVSPKEACAVFITRGK